MLGFKKYFLSNLFFETFSYKNHAESKTGRLVPDTLLFFKKRFIWGKSTAQKFSIQDFFSKCDQIRSFLRIWSHLLKKSLMKDFIFCAVLVSIYFGNPQLWYTIKTNCKNVQTVGPGICSILIFLKKAWE